MELTEAKQEAIETFAEHSPCVCFNIRKAARAVTQMYDDLFRDSGIRISQAAILTSLRKLGPLTVSQLAEAVATDRTTITRNLKPLERDKLIRIERGYDRREREISITEHGKEVAVKTFVIWENFQKRLEKRIGKERLETFCKDLHATMNEILEA